MLFGSEAWCLRESVMSILRRTESAVWGETDGHEEYQRTDGHAEIERNGG